MYRRLTIVAIAALSLMIARSADAQFFSPLVDFESLPIEDPQLSQEMFRIPETAPTTAAFIVANPTGTFTANSAFRSDDFTVSGNSSLRVTFQWVDETDPDAWVRLQTFNGEVWPNPSIHLQGKVRLRVLNVGGGDFVNGAFGICLGVRETGANVPQFEDGGFTGDIEWVGASGTVGTDPDIRPVPIVTVPVFFNALAIEFDLANGNVSTGPDFNNLTLQGSGIAGFTGDGVLDGTRGVLEHLAIVNLSGDPSVGIEFYLDEVQAEAPVADPVFPPTVQSPIIQGDTTITVDDLLSTADQVTLFRDGMMVQTLPVVDPNNPIDFTIAPPAVAGECFTATQRESISGDTSIPSAEVCTLPAAATYTFNICIDENGSNCSLDWEMVPAASRSTAPNGEIAPNGQIIFPNNAVWQTINIPLDVPGLTTPWLGGDGVVAPGGTGVYSIESMWFTSLGGADATGTQEVYLDAIEALDGGGSVIATIHNYEDGINYMSGARGQSTSLFTASALSTAASFDGSTSKRLEWSYPSTNPTETMAGYNAIGFACGTAPTFPDSTVTVRVRMLARTQYTGSAPQPAISAPIVGNQTSVRVLNDPSATAVQLYINGVAEGGPVLPSGPETDFAGLTLAPNDSVSATQVVSSETSDFALPVVVAAQPFPPTVQGGLVPLNTEVTVTGVADGQFATASLVEVFVNSVLAGSAVPAGDTVAVTVPSLNTNDVVEARQTVNGATSNFSAPVTVGFSAPTIYYPPAAGDTSVTVTGIDPTATDVTILVDAVPTTVAYDAMIEPFVVTVPALTAGQQIVARYSQGPIDSGDSTPETVSNNATTEVFCDDFEYASQAAFDAVWSPIATQMILSNDRNTTTGGMSSAFAPDRSYRSSPGVFAGVQGTDLDPAVFSINILDPSGGTGINQYADINDLTSDFFLAEIGMTNFGTGNPQTHYNCRLVGNGGADWFNLNQFDGPLRSAGWHNFVMIFKGPPEGETEGHEIDVYVDGLLAAKNVVLTTDTVLREPRMGSGIGSGGPEGYYDDYCLYTGPAVFPALPATPPTVVTPLEADETTVTVEGVSASASLVTVYANGSPIGSIDPMGADTVAVPVTALLQFDIITATQTTSSQSVPSSGLEVGKGNGDIFLSIGIRETGDAGPLGSPGSGTGSLEWIGTASAVDGAPQGQPVSPQAGWQTITFDPSIATGFTGDGIIDGTRGVLEHLAISVNSTSPNRSTGAYEIFIDNVINVGAGAGGADFVIADFEGAPLDGEALFQEPGNSGSTSANAVFPPDFSQTVAVGNPGQSQSLGWFWVDTTAQRWLRVTTGAVATTPSPIIDLTRPIQLDILIQDAPVCSIPGDVNGDGLVNLSDIDAYVLALLDPVEFAVQFPNGCLNNADVNNSGLADGADSQPFVDLLITP